MKFYHGTSYETWEKIQEEGILYGKSDKNDFRSTHLSFNPEMAECFGDVVLEVEYDPTVNPYKNTYSYSDGFAIRVEEAIPLENITFYCDVTKKREEERKAREEERLEMERQHEELRQEIERHREEERLQIEREMNRDNDSSTD